jgi:hypothetical protein
LFLHLSPRSIPRFVAFQGPPTLNCSPASLPATDFTSSPSIPHDLSHRVQHGVTKQRGYLRFIPYQVPQITPCIASHSPQVVRAPSPLIMNSDPQAHHVDRHLTRTESDTTDIGSPPSPIPPESTQILTMPASSPELPSNYRSVSCPWEGCNELVHGTRHDWSVHLTDKHEIGSELTVCEFDGCRELVKGTGMARHILTSHTKVEDEACSGCRTKLSRRDAFLRHQSVSRQCSESKLLPLSMISIPPDEEVVKVKAKQPPKMRRNSKVCQEEPRRSPRKHIVYAVFPLYSLCVLTDLSVFFSLLDPSFPRV